MTQKETPDIKPCLWKFKAPNEMNKLSKARLKNLTNRMIVSRTPSKDTVSRMTDCYASYNTSKSHCIFHIDSNNQKIR